MISIIRLPENYWKDYPPKRNTQKDYKDLAKTLGVSVSVIKVSFAIYVAHYILFRIKKSVKEQKVKGKPMKQVYKPLSPKYQKQKNPRNRNKFWVNNEELIKKLGVYQVVKGGKSFTHIGWRGRKQWRKDFPKVSMRKQLVYVERTRPLIRPIVNSAKSNISWLWDRYKDLVLKQNNADIKFKLH